MKTILALKTTLAKFPAEFARGRAGHAPLSRFGTVDALLGALALSSSASHAERDAITFALVTEHQRASHPLWQSLLLVAYEPMLANVRRRLRDRRTGDKTDAEARILLAFLEALAKVSLAHPPSLLALHLRHATERGVFGTDAASREEPELVPLTEARGEASPERPDARIEREDEMRKLTIELEALFGGEARIVLDILLRARTGREQLADLVAEWHPGMNPRARAAVYERYQRMRRRALLHLEARFGRELDRVVSAA